MNPIKTNTDPELDYAREQGAGTNKLWLFVGWLLLALAGLWAIGHEAMRWLKWKRVCPWCQPPRRVSGSPFPLCGITHTVCADCLRKAKRYSDSLKKVSRR